MSIFDMKFLRFLGFKKKPNAPWKKYYKTSDMDLKIPDVSLYEYFKEKSQDYNNYNAFDYFGKKTTYKELNIEIDKCADAFLNYGIRTGDVVTICAPNIPEAIITFLALNKIGAVSNMVHPLSGEKEIISTLKETKSVMLVLIDINYEKLKDLINETEIYKIIIISAKDSMPLITRIGYQFVTGHKTKKPSKTGKYIKWKTFLDEAKNYKSSYRYIGLKNEPATMLHSGGSTGSPKAVVLSNENFVTLVKQSKIVFNELKIQDKCLSIMPIFHGFGLGVCLYTPLCLGAECILIPQFNAKDFGKILMNYKPEFIIGVPTLFEAMIKSKDADKIKLNRLKYIISGGDFLKESVEKKINNFLFEHGSSTEVIQGYGMSECLAAIALDFKNNPKSGSVGIPFPGCYVGIFSPDDKEVPYKEEGEICISGPNVMLGYYNDEKETNNALHIHDDGNVWLHSGDLGTMDENGFIRYTSRLKRLIITSGYNVYPSQIEAILETHPAVMLSSVIGIEHKYKKEVPKAYIVLNKGFHKSAELINELQKMCKENLPKYAVPYEYEFRTALPKTLVGKVDFRKLQEENNEKRKEENK